MHYCVYSLLLSQTPIVLHERLSMEPKSLYVVILSCVFVHFTLIGFDTGVYHTLAQDGLLTYLTSKAVAYLLYPLLGWLADVYFTRYKFVLSSFVILLFTTLPSVVFTSLFLKFEQRLYLYMTGPIAIVGLIGLGMFESTAIQFGMDQMLEAPSEQFSTFIHWYYWSSVWGQPIIVYIYKGILFYFSQCKFDGSYAPTNDQLPHRYYHAYETFVTCITLYLLAALQFVGASIGLWLLLWAKKHLVITEACQHPLKLMYQVLRYSWKHKCPERRSAFTYWEEDIPRRIDLGKNKYGGPFSNEEVEDTKTFLRIVLLLLSLVGFHLSGQGYSLLDQLFRHQCPSSEIIFTIDTNTFTTLTIIIGIPVYRFVFVRYCSKYLPNMLKRMGLGLLCCFIRELIFITIHATMIGDQLCPHVIESVPMDKCFLQASKIIINGTCFNFSALTAQFNMDYVCELNNVPYLLVIIPSILQGFSYLLVFMTALEFICAQAPLRLKGLLIGLWYASLAVIYLVIEIPESLITDPITWEVFHEVKAFLIFLSLILYLCVSERYHYRQRDEVVNERFLVEQIYERQLAQAEEYERELRAERSGLLKAT